MTSHPRTGGVPTRRIRCAAAAIATIAALLPGWAVAAPAPAAQAGAADGGHPVAPGETRAHALFDDSSGPPRPGVAAGGAARPLGRAKQALGPRQAVPTPDGSRGPAAATPAPTGAPRDPEVLGFVQSGEVDSGSWTGDLRMDLLSTIAYFGVTVGADGSLVTGDYGYQVWRGGQATNLINAAHAAGDRVLLTVKQFDTPTIAAITGSEASRQRCITQIIGELSSRGGDGVDVDFEGSASTADFTTFVSELQYGLRTRIAGSSYLIVSTYGSSPQGGTMFDIGGLRPYVDAFDVMAYDLTSPASTHAGPVAPLNGYTYTDTGIVNSYLALIPPSQLLLGVPYYGYKWSTTSADPQAATIGSGTADTYSDALADFSCAEQLTLNFDPTFYEPWATWYSPSSGDPCGGNHGSWRELYYENATSLGGKYDLDNTKQLRGIGIWALGYDSGHPDLWNQISAKFSVTHFSEVVVQHFYQDLLGRAADPAGLQSWTAALDRGASRTWVAEQFVASSEYRHHLVNGLFTVLLHRTADVSGLEFWSNALASSITVEQAKAAFIGSDEYYARRGGSTSDGFLDALYADVLDRSPDPGGRSYWDQVLQQGMSRTSVGWAFVTSSEGYAVLVQSFYQQLLGRSADPGGLSSWVSAMQRGASDQQVTAEFAGSAEYYNRVTG